MSSWTTAILPSGVAIRRVKTPSGLDDTSSGPLLEGEVKSSGVFIRYAPKTNRFVSLVMIRPR
jgi:hypothetical protein